MYAKCYGPGYDRHFKRHTFIKTHAGVHHIDRVPCTLWWLLHPISLSVYDKCYILSLSLALPRRPVEGFATNVWHRAHCAICSILHKSFHRCVQIWCSWCINHQCFLFKCIKSWHWITRNVHFAKAATSQGPAVYFSSHWGSQADASGGEYITCLTSVVYPTKKSTSPSTMPSFANLFRQTPFKANTVQKQCQCKTSTGQRHKIV